MTSIKQQTAAAERLQSAIRRRTDMMKKRQLVDEEQLKQMEETQRQIQAAKADKEKKEDIAAKQLQAISKRIKAQSDVSKIKQFLLGLLTEEIYGNLMLIKKLSK